VYNWSAHLDLVGDDLSEGLQKLAVCPAAIAICWMVHLRVNNVAVSRAVGDGFNRAPTVWTNRPKSFALLASVGRAVTLGVPACLMRHIMHGMSSLCNNSVQPCGEAAFVLQRSAVAANDAAEGPQVKDGEESGLKPHVDASDSDFWADGSPFLDPSLEQSQEGQDWEAPQASTAAMMGVRKSVFDRIQEDFPRTPSPVIPQNFTSTGKPAHSKALPSPSNKGKKNLIESEVRAQTQSALENLSAAHPALQQLSLSSITLPPGMGPGSATATGASHLEMVNEDSVGEDEVGLDQRDMTDQMTFLMQQQQLLMQQQQQQQQQQGMRGQGSPGKRGYMMPMQNMGGMGMGAAGAMGYMGGGLQNMSGMGRGAMGAGQGHDLMDQYGFMSQGVGRGNFGGGAIAGMSLEQVQGMMAMMAMGGMQGQGMGALQSSTGGLPGAEALGAGSGMAPAINPAMMSQLSGMFPHMQQQGMGLDNNLMARNMELLQNMATQGTGSGPSGGMMGEISGRGRQPRNQMHQQRGFGHGLGSSSGPSDGQRSSVLEEFRNNKSRKFELRDVIDCCEEFCRDQHGSRFIQTKLDGASSQEKQMVFDALQPKALELMTDLFGNYVVQKFLERGTPEQKRALAQCMHGKVLELSLDMYGCRVVQKAIEVMEGSEQEELVRELKGHVMKCVRDQNGNHVIQKCIERTAPEAVQFIVQDFAGQVMQLATHPYGCRVIQRILEHCRHSQVQSSP